MSPTLLPLYGRPGSILQKSRASHCLSWDTGRVSEKVGPLWATAAHPLLPFASHDFIPPPCPFPVWGRDGAGNPAANRQQGAEMLTRCANLRALDLPAQNS